MSALVSPIVEARLAITKKVCRMSGKEVPGLYDALSVLTGPDVLPLLKNLIEVIETEDAPTQI